MSRIKKIRLWLTCSLFCLFVVFPAWAATEGEAVPKRNGQTEVQAGVVVDYMGKLRFVVLERGTLVPIPEASVEIYIPALDRHVLFGLTDSNGIFELDIAYNMDPNVSDSVQFNEDGGNYTFNGSPLYLSSNNIRYRIYKVDWLPYPSVGETVLETKEVPQVITIYLHKKGGGGGGGGGGSSGGTSIPHWNIGPINEILDTLVPKGSMDSGGIPKTGVEGAMPYWLLGFVFFLLAGGTMYILLKKENAKEKEKSD